MVRESVNTAREATEGLTRRGRWAMEAFGVTDPGRRRLVNEDHFVIADMVRSVLVERTSLPRVQVPTFSEAHRRLLLVADGVGGHAGGELASRMVADALVGYLADAIPIGVPLPAGGCSVAEREIRAGIEHCQVLIDRIAESETTLGRMGTTVTLAYLIRPYMVIGHVGDSRCYLLRNGKLQQLTRDHTVRQERVDAGAPNPDHDAGSGDTRITGAIAGGLFGVAPDVFTVDVRPADVVLLCTDGLTKELDEGTIRNILDAGWPPHEACRLLIETANRAGGRDNITCVVCRLGPSLR